jgi:hypothetical protein
VFEFWNLDLGAQLGISLHKGRKRFIRSEEKISTVGTFLLVKNSWGRNFQLNITMEQSSEDIAVLEETVSQDNLINFTFVDLVTTPGKYVRR